MPEDRFKRYQTAGTDFLETARARAEDFLRELAKATESTQKQASEQVDDLVSAGRRSTDQIFDSVRREVAAQLSQLGLVTQKDLDALERRLTGKVAAPAKKAPAKKATAKKASGTKATATKAAAKKAAPAKSTAKKAPAKKAPAKKATAKKAAGPGSTSGSTATAS